MNALLNPSVRQIVAQVDAILRHDPTATVIGIRAQGDENWPARVPIGDREFSLAWCPSPISVREQLVAFADEAGALSGQSSATAPGLVVLTPLSDQALGADVVARLSRGKVFPVEAWDMLRHAFQAKEIDSRLARWSWVAEALLENLPAGGYPPARGGVLDVDTAWSHTLRSVLGMSTEQGGRPDLPSVLRWTLSPEAARRYGGLNEKARRQIGEWLIEILGSCGRLIGQVLDAGYGGELMPIALVCGIVLDRPEGTPVSPELLAAAVRLEKFTGGVPVPMREGLRLYAAAVQVAGAMDSSTLMPILDVADRLAESLHLTNFAHLSNDLPSGFSSRLMLFADAITAFLAAQSTSGAEKKVAVRSAATDAVLVAGQCVIAHRLATHQAHRVRRVEMSMRLVRWLAQADAPPHLGLEAQVKAYADDGAYADWARLALLGGDELAGATRAYGALREAARVRRDAMNKQFSQALAAWNQGGCPKLQSVIPVEQIVTDVLAPAAALAPVLLLVVDGLSFPIYRELLEDAQRQGWNEVLPNGSEQAAAGLATIPSITEISRTSLFCGRLIQGQAANEKSGFAQHPALIPLVPSNRLSAKPVLFHKGDLTAGGDGIGLSEAVRDAIGSRERKVVAIVFNGVDDHLSGSDQLNQRWTLDDLRLIKPILYEARNAGRLALITADHGHLIDEATHVLAGLNDGTDKASAKSAGFAMGDRWRNLAGAPVSAEEVLLSGGRVMAPSGQQQVVVPWSEALRYGSRKNGYHGGITLQEMLVPIAVLTTGGSAPEGFRYAPSALPAWWDLAVLSGPTQASTRAQATLKAPAKKAKGPSAADALQHPLFELPAAETPQQMQPKSPDSDWIAGLLVSSVFVSQKQWVARAAVKDDEIRALLEALSERGGKISKAALAGRLSMPLMRVSGFVNAARRLLNVDQAPVIILDETEGSVSLNRSLLDTQFFSNKGSQQ